MSETPHRSLLKGFTWRIIGTVDTIVLSWIFTGAVGKALKIGGIEFFTKLLLFYLHERIWLVVPWARKTVTKNGVIVPHDEHHRSLIKGISWRITGSIDTIIIAFFITGEASKALSIGMAEVVTKVLLYYAHERAWQRLSFGRHAARIADAGTTPQMTQGT